MSWLVAIGVVASLCLLVRYARQDQIENATPESIARWRRTAQRYRASALEARREYDLAGEDLCDRLADDWDAKADQAEALLRKRQP